MPHDIEIYDSDIREIEAALEGVRFSDDHRMAALRCNESQDIQACPGSGKTTLLVAKLAILARKWRWKDRGILVLSHTNVAREEIQKKLARVGGHNLLQYPHFVGTIQRFSNRFLALPHLRNSGLTDYRIDDVKFGDRAQALLARSPAFSTLRTTLQHSYRNEAMSASVIRGLRFVGAELSVDSANGALPCSLESRSGKQLVKLKERISGRELIFRFDDMFALAERYLSKNPQVVSALRHRFPWVFVDEMQDTDHLQNRLLAIAFQTSCTVQRIGDSNQAIFKSAFQEESETDFPSDGALQLPGSIRYCPEIAQLAMPLTRAEDYQDLSGNPEVTSRQHTIFTFSEESIKEVLPAFGALLQKEFGEILPDGFRAMAVGGRKSGEAKKRKQIPYCISDYFDAYLPTLTRTPTSLWEFFQSARAKFKLSRNFGDGWRVLIDGFLELVRRQGIVDKATSEVERPRKHSRRDLIECLKDSGSDRPLRLLVSQLLTAEGEPGAAEWKEVSGALWQILASGLGQETKELNAEAKEFIRLKETDSDAASSSLHRRTNLYRHPPDGRLPEVKIGLSTIHAAKGQTHTATLVLDTFNKTHDLKKLIPFLLGSQRKISPADKKRMKRTYVAMTRPRELLCLAIRKDHLEAKRSNRRKFEEIGWTVQEL